MFDVKRWKLLVTPSQSKTKMARKTTMKKKKHQQWHRNEKKEKKKNKTARPVRNHDYKKKLINLLFGKSFFCIECLWNYYERAPMWLEHQPFYILLTCNIPFWSFNLLGAFFVSLLIFSFVSFRFYSFKILGAKCNNNPLMRTDVAPSVRPLLQVFRVFIHFIGKMFCQTEMY